MADLLRDRFPGVHAKAEMLVTHAFHRLYYGYPERTWENTRWLGVPLNKFPTDLWVYQEILYELRPDWIIETGTSEGGSAYFLACLCDLIGHGQVVSIDIEHCLSLPQHPRITYLVGSSTAPEILEQVRAMSDGVSCRLVVLDSDHSYEHVADELDSYSELVTPGSYLIVEDTNIGGHPVMPYLPTGPYEAAQDFLARDPRYEVDTSREKFFLTTSPQGYLRRRASAA